jgi:hypothetical protein
VVDHPSQPPETSEIDEGWDVDDEAEEPAPPTVAVESVELLNRAGMAPAPRRLSRPDSQSSATTARALPLADQMREAALRDQDPGARGRADKNVPAKIGLRRPTARKLTPMVRDAAVRARNLDQRATLPPPVPPSEYVSRMMGQLDPERSPNTVPSPAALEDDATPLIETVEGVLDDIDPDLLRDTPVPDAPPLEGGAVDPGASDDSVDLLASTTEVPAADAVSILKKAEELSELDDLPIDSVLGAISEHADRATPIPGGEVGSDDLWFALSTTEPPTAPSISDFPLDGTGLSGPPVEGAGTAGELDPMLQPVEERFSVGDYSGALVLAEGLLEEHPGHPQILRYVESCGDMLRQMYLSRLGHGSDIPRVAVAPAELRWLTLDHRAGFLLSCIDGTCSIDEVLDVATMPHLEALRTLYELVQEGVVEIASSTGRR